ncbi:MAG TPA: radical SAM protein [Candidatus Omnitrophota bacterium]|nr:radical SAM protein [Candidatus Omnitrophota bacterium]
MYSAPLNICFGITSRCNLSCKHCINRNIPHTDPDLTTEELFRVIDQLGDAKVFQVNIFGGEPLTHPDFFLIVERLNKYPIRLTLNTNGTLIDSKIAKRLKEHKIRGVTVSFDGSCPEVMDAARGVGTFKKNIKGIEALLSEGIYVLLSATLTKINYKDTRGMTMLGKKLGANLIRFNHVFFAGNAACFAKEIYLSHDEELGTIEEIHRLNKEFPGFIDNSSTYLCQRGKLEEMKDYEPAYDKISVPPCGAAQDKCNIRPDGWITPCEIIWEAKCGNLRKQSFLDIWRNSKLMNEFRKTLEIDLNTIPECKGCKYQLICFIGHRCDPYYYPGGIKDRSVYCWLNNDKKKGKVLDVVKR